MWVAVLHALAWVPKVLLWGAQRIATWTGTVYLFRKGRERKIYYFLSALLYLGSWTFLILAVWKMALFKRLAFHIFLPGRAS